MFSEDQESGFGAEGGRRDRKIGEEKKRRSEVGYGWYTRYAEVLEKGSDPHSIKLVLALFLGMLQIAFCVRHYPRISILLGPRHHLLDFPRVLSRTHFLLLCQPALQIQNTELKTVLP
jgi:hypothetical protein